MTAASLGTIPTTRERRLSPCRAARAGWSTKIFRQCARSSGVLGQGSVPGRVDHDSQNVGAHRGNPGYSHDVPQADDGANAGRNRSRYLRNRHRPRAGETSPEGFLPVLHDQRSQQRKHLLRRHGADLGGRSTGWSVTRAAREPLRSRPARCRSSCSEELLSTLPSVSSPAIFRSVGIRRTP